MIRIGMYCPGCNGQSVQMTVGTAESVIQIGLDGKTRRLCFQGEKIKIDYSENAWKRKRRFF